MGNHHLLTCQVEKIVVGRRVSFPLHILFPLFGIPHLIYSCNSFQVICEILSDPLWYSNTHYTVIIYILQLWLKSLGNDCKVVHCLGCLLKALGLYPFKFICHNCRTATVQICFLQNAYFFRTYFGGKFCYCTVCYYHVSTRFIVNLYTIVVWMSRNSLLETGAISEV